MPRGRLCARAGADTGNGAAATATAVSTAKAWAAGAHRRALIGLPLTVMSFRDRKPNVRPN
jgi:hypothetical protein